MEKSAAVIPKKGNKQPKAAAEKKQPLKVVYITNPIKFKASASEFRALVQELTGQDADVPETSRFAAADAGEEAEGNVVGHAPEDVAELGQTEIGGIDGSDLSAFGSYDDGGGGGVYDPQMMGGFQGFAGSNMLWYEDGGIDVFKSLGAM